MPKKKSDNPTTTIDNIIFHAPQKLKELEEYLAKQTNKCYVVILTKKQLENESELMNHHTINRSLQTEYVQEFTKTKIEHLYTDIQQQESKNPINVVCCCDEAMIRSQVVNAALQLHAIKLHAISNRENPPDPEEVLKKYKIQNPTADEIIEVQLEMMGFIK